MPVIALIIVHPLGRAWDLLLKREDDPDEVFEYGALQHRTPAELSAATSSLQHLRFWLAQGRWNEKEHACEHTSSNVSFAFALANDLR